MKPEALKLAISAALTVTLYGTFFALFDALSTLYTSQTFTGSVAVLATAMIFSAIHGTFAHYLLKALGFHTIKGRENDGTRY